MKEEELWVISSNIMPYSEAFALQEKLVIKRKEGIIKDTLLLLEHNPTVTVPSKKALKNIIVPIKRLTDEGIMVVSTNRGGDVTYHGPGQLVGYLIMDLNFVGKDLHRYIYSLETMIIRCLKDFDVVAYRDNQYRGVWVNNEKIAAIGIAVKHPWISMHGFSININPRLEHFSFILPCGINNKSVTSLSKVLGRIIARCEVEQSLIRHLSCIFNRKAKEITLSQIENWL